MRAAIADERARIGGAGPLLKGTLGVADVRPMAGDDPPGALDALSRAQEPAVLNRALRIGATFVFSRRLGTVLHDALPCDSRWSEALAQECSDAGDGTGGPLDPALYPRRPPPSGDERAEIGQGVRSPPSDRARRAAATARGLRGDHRTPLPGAGSNVPRNVFVRRRPVQRLGIDHSDVLRNILHPLGDPGGRLSRYRRRR